MGRAAAAALWLVTLLAFAGDTWWVLGLLTHFRPQYLALSAAGALVLGVAGRRRVAAALGLCALVNAVVLWPYLVPGARSSPEPRSALAKALLVNVQTGNRDHGAVRALIAREAPDVIVLLEVDRTWLAALADLHRSHPFNVTSPRDDNFGIALFSRHPCLRCEVVPLGDAGLPAVIGEFATGERFTVVGVHLVPPVGAGLARLQAEQFRALTERLANVKGPTLLLGDFNATPWSPRLDALLDGTRLRDAARGRWLWRTWPVGMPPLGIPIDHALHSPGVTVVQHRRGPDVGSDHFPVIVGFRPHSRP